MRSLVCLLLGALAPFTVSSELAGQSVLLEERFEYSVTGQFPPTGWSMDILADPWSRGWVEPAAVGETGFYLDGVDMARHNSPAGGYPQGTTWQDNRLVTPLLDLSQASAPVLEFDHAVYRSYCMEIHGLGYVGESDVEVSTDLGLTWTNVWSVPWMPNGEVRHQRVDLSTFAGQPQVLIGFRYYGVRAPFTLDHMWSLDNLYVLEETPNARLYLDGTCGQPDSSLLGLRLTPDALVGLLFSPTLGSYTHLHGCGPITTGLASPRLVAVLRADHVGTVRFAPPQGLPSGACGRFVQAVDLGSCRATNVLPL